MRAALLIAAILIGGIAAPTVAQTVTIRSGEHDGFTRLVLTIPAGTVWDTTTTPEGYRLTLAGDVDGFDLGSVFDRIPRDRILGVSSDAAALDVAVSCECHVETFLYRNDMLVLDVIEGPAPLQTTTGAERADADPAAPPDPPGQVPPSPILPVLPGGLPPGNALLLPGGFDVEAVRSDDLIDTERAILESFARAASQGVFDFPSVSTPQGADGAPSPLGHGLTPVTDPMDGVALSVDEDEPRPGLIVRTGIARSGDTDAADEVSGPCDRLGRMDVSGWIDEDASFVEEIGAGRFAMTSETGRVIPGEVVMQARRYVAFGFGLEALEVLSILEDDVPDDLHDDIRTVQTLARIVDGAAMPDTAVAGSIGCGPDAAIWAALARGSLEGTDERHRDAALAGYRQLPESLRGHLGLRLAAMFSRAGEHHVASEILLDARGEVTGSGLQAALTEADLAGAEHGPTAEIARLDAIVTRNASAEPETIVRLLDLSVEEGMTTASSVLDLAQAVRRENGGEAVEAELARAETRALVVAGDYGAALALIAETADVIGPDLQALLIDETIEDLSVHASDDAFLEIALVTGADAITPDVQNLVAARLLDLGFPDLAGPFLHGGAERQTMRERRYLRGTAAAALGDVEATETALEGMTDPRAQEIRAAARSMAGDFTGAYEARDDMDPEAGGSSEAVSAAELAAWRAGDWTGLETSEDPLLSSASRAILTPQPVPGAETPLADRQSLLDDASSTRAMTEALLERFSVDPEDGS